MKQERQQKNAGKSHATKTPSKKRKANPLSPEEEEGESSPEWVEVLVDVLLALESQASLMWRSVVELVFRGIVHRITPGAVGLIANVRGWV